jgi:hypothetical protein
VNLLLELFKIPFRPFPAAISGTSRRCIGAR